MINKMSNIYELKQELMEKRMKKFQIYEDIYEKVVSKIKFTNSNTDNCYCTYEFKRMEFGIPKYDISECISYICEKLRKNKFKVGVILYNKIMISWLHILEQQNKRERQLNEQITLMDLKEKQNLFHQNQFNQMRQLDNKYIQKQSHFSDTLQQFPLYNMNTINNNMNTMNNMNTINNNMIDYTKLNSSSVPKNTTVKKIDTSKPKNYGNIKSPAQLESSMELDKLLSEFDNNSLL